MNAELQFRLVLGWRINCLRWSRWHDDRKPLAELMKVTTKTISNWERGERHPYPYEIAQLARIFGVTTDFLMNGSTLGLGSDILESVSAMGLLDKA